MNILQFIIILENDMSYQILAGRIFLGDPVLGVDVPVRIAVVQRTRTPLVR